MNTNTPESIVAQIMDNYALKKHYKTSIKDNNVYVWRKDVIIANFVLKSNEYGEGLGLVENRKYTKINTWVKRVQHKYMTIIDASKQNKRGRGTGNGIPIIAFEKVQLGRKITGQYVDNLGYSAIIVKANINWKADKNTLNFFFPSEKTEFPGADIAEIELIVAPYNESPGFREHCNFLKVEAISFSESQEIIDLTNLISGKLYHYNKQYQKENLIMSILRMFDGKIKVISEEEYRSLEL